MQNMASKFDCHSGRPSFNSRPSLDVPLLLFYFPLDVLHKVAGAKLYVHLFAVSEFSKTVTCLKMYAIVPLNIKAFH